MVPEGWSFKTLDSAKIKVIDGDRGKEYPKASDFLETGYCLFLSAKNVTKAGFLFEDLQFINEDKDKKLRKGRVERGNIVLTTRGSVGQFAYYDNSIPYDVIRINSGMVVIDATQSELLPEFFYALCRSFIVAKQIEAASFGSAQPQLTVGIIKGIKLPIPSLPEQKKIAQILSTWDKAITTTEQLLANSQQQKKALMQQLLTGPHSSKPRLLDKNGVRFSGEWESNHLKKLFQISKGNQLNKDTLSKSGEYAVINGGIELSGYTSEYNTEANTITISEGGNSCGFVGLQSNRFWCGGHCYAIKNLKIDLNFTYQLLKFNQSKIMRLRVGSGLPNIQKKDLEALSVEYPISPEEQQKIAAVLSTADQEVSVLQQKLDALKQEKKALMQQLLTGKRRVMVDA